MTQRITPVKPDDPISAGHYNQIVQAANADSVGGGWGNTNRLLISSEGGGAQATPPTTQNVLCELTQRMTHGITDGVEDDVLSADCKIVWYFPVGDPDFSNQYEPTDQQFFSTGGIIKVYFPTLLRQPVPADSTRDTSFEYGPATHEAHGTTTVVDVGDRFYVIFNHQSGRWEFMGQPSVIVRFELTEELTEGNDAQAKIHVATGDADIDPAADADQEIRVYDWIGCFSGDEGAKGYARRFADMGRWEILYMCPPPIPVWYTYGDTPTTYTTPPITIIWTSEPYSGVPYYSSSSGIIVIENLAGDFHIQYDYTNRFDVGNEGTGTSQGDVWIEEDPNGDSTWSEVLGSRRSSEHHSGGAGYSSVHGEGIVTAVDGSRYRMRAERQSGDGTLESLPARAKIYIEPIPGRFTRSLFSESSSGSSSSSSGA